jgi:short-subunit dehydrogenase
MLQLCPNACKDTAMLLTGVSGDLGAQLALQLAELQVKVLVPSACSRGSLQTVVG